MGLLGDAWSGLTSGASDLWGSVTGRTQAEAARQGAQTQTQFGREAFNLIRGDLAPATQTLEGSSQALQNFVLGGESALDNPLFKRYSDLVTQKTLAAQAAGGRVGAGDTGTALADALIPLAMNFRNQRFGELLNFANFGSNAASMAGGMGSDILQGIGNAQAGGLIGAANAQGQGAQNILKIGGAIAGALSDRTMKRDITKVGKIKDLNVYRYRYKDIDDDKFYVGVMAQEVEKLYPNAIDEHDGIKFVDYDTLDKELGGELYGT